MMIKQEIHTERPWKINKIANDFTLWDVWEIPIEANNSNDENFSSFYKIATETFLQMQNKLSLASFLFALRHWIGKVIPFDKNLNTLPIPGCTETSLKSRLSEQELEASKRGKAITDDKTGLGFNPVYLFEDESLHEISNDTVHAMLHFGWIKKDDYYRATLAIYVKPRGFLGRSYLKLIEPFRHYIVYPTMMKMIKLQWQTYLSAKA